MKFIFSLFISCFLFIGCNAAVQDTLSIDPHALDSISTVYGDTSFINITVYNTGIDTFNDFLSFDYTINGNPYNSDTISGSAGSGISFSYAPVIILPHDSIVLPNIFVLIHSPQFIIGSSIVVIWPRAQNVSTVIIDSATRQMNIVSSLSGINDPERERLKIYMQGQQLWVQCDLANQLKEIRIYNTLGELLTARPVTQNIEIPMNHYAIGVYFVEVILNNNKREVFKVFNAPIRQ